MRESAPLIWHEATNSYIISRYEDVGRAFKDKASVFTTENYHWQPEGAWAPWGERHSRGRRTAPGPADTVGGCRRAETRSPQR
ncbi:hypothetical protein ACIBLA_18670 [Streptomyces sp. NPDC050433]|uniref:hypothetical protein n=1 Tax=Streptomyces sp. NPDC050433 TaxID=3365615 RepID=UPI0037A8A2BD